jgi:cytochrome b subunit of formate dehydrogenase
MPDQRLVRHTLSDRLFHWITAVSVLTLLGTSLLPILGLQFSWVTVHWIAGIVLTVAILFHIIRAVFWQDLWSMWINTYDIKAMLTSLNPAKPAELKPGKYSFAQKFIHLGFTVFTLIAIGTGLVMMVKVDTPFWTRDPYWLDSATWGWIYVAHGAAALIFVTMVMLHIYFALRPEKLLYTRSMIKGWITREEYEAHHDNSRWNLTPTSNKGDK